MPLVQIQKQNKLSFIIIYKLYNANMELNLRGKKTIMIECSKLSIVKVVKNYVNFSSTYPWASLLIGGRFIIREGKKEVSKLFTQTIFNYLPLIIIQT